MKAKPQTRKAVLRLKLGSCLSAPGKRMAADLHEVAELSNRAANAMLGHWLAKARTVFGKPVAFGCKGLPNGRLNKKTGKRSVPRPARQFTVMDMGDVVTTLPDDLTSTKIGIELYRAGQLAAPALHGAITAAHSSSTVFGLLLKKSPWRMGRRSRTSRMWQAILWHDGVSVPCLRATSFPVPSAEMELKMSPGGGYTLRFPLWSKEAGRAKRHCVCRIETRQLPRGVREIVQRVVSGQGDWKICDSEIVFHKQHGRHKKGWWALHLCYERPPCPALGNPDTVARLRVNKGDSSWPFTVETDGAFPVHPGIRALDALMHRQGYLELRHEVISETYSDGTGRKGHGRGKALQQHARLWQACRHLAMNFIREAVAGVIAYCNHQRCGKLAWTLPREVVRKTLWFAAKEVRMDWTEFETRLAYHCWLNGIAIVDVIDETTRIARIALNEDQQKVAEQAAGKATKNRGGDGSPSQADSQKGVP